jgi:hypothetical protein
MSVAKCNQRLLHENGILQPLLRHIAHPWYLVSANVAQIVHMLADQMVVYWGCPDDVVRDVRRFAEKVFFFVC